MDEYADVDFLISTDERKERLGSEELVLLDCKTPEVYEKGHITGAVNLLWQDLLNDNGTPKSKEEITGIMAGYGVEPDDDFTVY